MEYTIKKLAELAGVSTRTLRYYDEIGLLKPCRVNSSGYRIYGEQEVDILQQILFYRAMDMRLEDIQQIILQKEFNINSALESHYKRLLDRREQIDQLLATIEKTMKCRKGEVSMSDKDKFEGFKKEKLEKNEAKYGSEIRERYGEETVKASNQKFMKLTEAEFNEMQQVEEDMIAALIKVNESKDLKSLEAETVYEKHKAWLGYTWNFYSKEAHANLGMMYVADERFSKYYEDKAFVGAANLLCDIIKEYTTSQ